VSANTQQLSEMLEGQGQRAMDGVKGWLREEKASDWLVRTSSTHC
jgi:FAD/FMN-containing dehydrogenase